MSDVESYQERYARLYTMNTAGKQVLVKRVENVLRRRADGGILIDVGCGPGEIAPLVTRLKYQYLGVDNNPHMLTKIDSGKAILADARDLPLKKSCASVVLMNMLVHSFDGLWGLDMAVENAVRVLRPNGWLIATMLTEDKTSNLVEPSDLNVDTRPKPITYAKSFPLGELEMKASHWPVSSVTGILEMCSLKTVKKTVGHFELIVASRQKIWNTFF